jgi:predicted RND superfamily exporter protein
VLLLILSALGKHVQYEQSIASFFPENDPTVIAYRRAAESFGSDQFVFVAYEDPDLLTPAGMDRVKALASALQPARIPGVLRVESLDAMPLPWRIDEQILNLARLPGPLRSGAFNLLARAIGSGTLKGDALGVDAAIRAAKTPAALAELRARVTAHPLFRGTLIDPAGRTTALVVRLDSPENHDVKATIRAIRDAADSFARDANITPRPAVVGPPALLADGFTSIEEDGRRLALAGLFLIGLVTYTATRSIWWAAVPLVAAWTVWLSADTLLALAGLRLSLSSGPMIAQIIVLTMPAASHLALHFRDELHQTADRLEAARNTMRAVAKPILWCAATGTIGYAALLTSNVVPIRQFGLILAICTGLAALLTFAISPVAMLPPGRPRFLAAHARAEPAYARLGERITQAVLRHPLVLILATLLLVLPLTLGIPRLQYETNYINAFAPTSRVVQDYRWVESRLGGIGVIYLIIPRNAPIDSDALSAFRDLDAELAAVQSARGAPLFDHIVSLATVLDPDASLAKGKSRGFDPVTTKLDLIAASPQRDLLAGFWNPESGVARTLLRLVEQQPAEIKGAAFDAALTAARARFGPQVELTGLSHLLTQTTRGVIATQWSTVFWSTGSILLMLTLAFRGPFLAILAILPSLLSVSFALGLMGWLRVPLDLATAVVASVALGLSVDDTFHCLLQFRRQRGLASYEQRLLESYRITGPGVLLSSLAVAAGFLVLRFSPFVPFANFGSMVGVATLGSSLGNVLLLPACLQAWNRWQNRRGPKPQSTPAIAAQPLPASDD